MAKKAMANDPPKTIANDAAAVVAVAGIMIMETRSERIARLQREIAERQTELAHLILGDQSQGVTLPLVCDHRHYVFEKHGRRCTCGALMVDWGD